MQRCKEVVDFLKNWRRSVDMSSREEMKRNVKNKKDVDGVQNLNISNV